MGTRSIVGYMRSLTWSRVILLLLERDAGMRMITLVLLLQVRLLPCHYQRPDVSSSDLASYEPRLWDT